MVRKIFGYFFIGMGALGLIIEFSDTVALHKTDYFGVGLALAFICIGGLFLTYKALPRKEKDPAPAEDKEPAEEKAPAEKKPDEVRDIRASLDNICLVGLVLSILQLAAGLVIGLAGGILMSALFSKGEPGWGILGVGISVLGIFFLIFGVLRTVGYLHLKKRRFSGFILVFICETFAFLGGLFSIIMGNVFMAAIPFIWSVIVLVYLVKERYSFFHDSESEEKK
ncbi:MAG TPA: hypothetical protein PLL34_03005 [Candidatus Mcinerneyibacteriales bacterium]|nr:hypothetical protein [Candidatus Mcinerneyibacteriales bacterium]HPQ88554.1 hypothetical protein [Candidatus Mcinerneyibacteriales bacterium]